MTENPLSFDKLFKQNRLKIYSNIQEYLNSKKTSVPGVGNSKVIPSETCRELFITSHESLRLGEAPYLLQYLNTLKALQKPAPSKSQQQQISAQAPELSILLTDPLLGNSSFLNNKLMRPFHPFNKVNVVYLPVTSAVGCCDFEHLAQLLKHIAPKRIVADKKIQGYFQMSKDVVVDGELEVGTCVHILSAASANGERKAGGGSYLLGKIESSVAQDIRMERMEESQASDVLKMVGKVGRVKVHCKDQLVKIEREAEEAGTEQLYLIG